MADDKREETSEDEEVAAARGEASEAEDDDRSADDDARGDEAEADADAAEAVADAAEADADAAEADADAAEADADADEPDAHAGQAATKREGEAKRGRKFSLWWILPAAMLVEFYVYGRNGYIDVCVGKQGQTDFSLVGQPRTDDNRWKFPRCERRINLGLRSSYDEKLADGVKVACRQATLFRHQGESAQCEAADGGWVHQVDTSFCPPWDPNYYKHLFWFLQ
mgnify:CR=1 FL=1